MKYIEGDLGALKTATRKTSFRDTNETPRMNPIKLYSFRGL